MSANEIARFNGLYKFLSNFSPCDIYFEGNYYPTTEHAYQAAKTSNPVQRDRIRRALTPGLAKSYGGAVFLRPGWKGMRLAVMEELLRQKFKPGTELAKKLLETGDATLIEGNSHGDRFWGVCKGKGLNNLGRLLMKIRSELELRENAQ